MGIIIFCVLSVAACLFLIYVLVHFHQEVVRLEKKPAGDSVTYVGSDEISPALADPSFGATPGQQANDEAVVRRGMLISGILALVGLFAPFVLAKLLHSPAIWHR